MTIEQLRFYALSNALLVLLNKEKCECETEYVGGKQIITVTCSVCNAIEGLEKTQETLEEELC